MKNTSVSKGDKLAQQLGKQPSTPISTGPFQSPRRKESHKIQEVRAKVSSRDVKIAEAALRRQKMSLTDRWDQQAPVKPMPSGAAESKFQDSSRPANVFESLFATAQSR